MKQYFLINTNVDPSQIIRVISNAEYETIIKNQNLIAHFKYSTRRIKETKGNFSDLKNYHFDAQEIILKKPQDLINTLENIFINYNRLLINFCTSLKFTVDYLERKIKLHAGQLAFDNFKSWITAIYDTNFSYRLFYNLRNFIQHCEYPLKDFKVDRERYYNTQIILFQELSIVFDKNYLINNKVLQKKLNGLQGFGNYFPIQPYLLEIEKIIDSFIPKLTEIEIDILKNACTELDIITGGEKEVNYGYFNDRRSYRIENDFIERI